MNEYLISELSKFRVEIAECERDSLEDRKASKAVLHATLQTNLEHYQECINWLLNGSYGQGASIGYYMLGSRSNKKAWLFNAIAALEYRVPQRMACKLWHELGTELQAKVNQALESEIAFRAEEDRENGALITLEA